MREPCVVIQEQLGTLFACTGHGDYTKIRTPYLYPDGDRVDLFLAANAQTPTLTDLGETLRWLRMQTTAQRRSPKQNQLLQDIALTHGVEIYQGMLNVRVRDETDLTSALTRLSQAVLRVSDLWFTFRTRTIETVTDEVGDYFVEKEVPFERGHRQPGRSGRIWSVDFHVRAPLQSSFVFVLSTGSKAAARGVAEHVVAACHDMSHLRVGPEAVNFVSLFDDTFDVWTPEDFRLVEGLSQVSHWSKPEELLEAIGMVA
jgi:hypothetical protein